MPRRCSDRLAIDGPVGGLSDRALAAAEQQLRGWRFTPNGSEGYAKAEVTIGGISTAELSSQTMDAKRVPGLFVIGEAVDVTGWLGGYNFQWAWASGGRGGRSALGARQAMLQRGKNLPSDETRTRIRR